MKKRTETNSLELVARNAAQLGSALHRFRKRREWTQQKAGERSGIKQNIVSHIESGSSGTQVGTLFKLLAGLDLELVLRKRKKSTSEVE